VKPAGRRTRGTAFAARAVWTLLLLTLPGPALAQQPERLEPAAEPHLTVLLPDGTVLLQVSLADDPAWIIRWNHSVTGIVVSDYYQFDGETMYLSASHTPSFAAGLGHIPGRGRVESDDRHGYWILGIDEAVPGNAYNLRVGSSRVNHRLIHAGSVHSLSDTAAGQRVTIGVTR
jgi:hypothetical protein